MEEQADYITDAQEMMGKGYEHPSLEVHPQQTIIRRSGREMEEEVIPAFVKISTSFKQELDSINGDALKVWLFIALSINRNNGQAHPGVRTIAKACKVGINQVTAHVKHLEELGLLAVNREDRKYNIYEIPDYVSANTVTPKVTDGKTVTSEKKTVTSKRKTVTPISDLTREPEKPERDAPDFQNMTVSEARKLPTLKLYREATGIFPGNSAWGFVHKFLTDNKMSKAKIREAYEVWGARGYNPYNVEGILEWARDGVPGKKSNKDQSFEDALKEAGYA